MEEISRASASVGLSYGAHSNLCVNQIRRWANDEQKAKYLPKLVSGEHVGSLAMSEASAARSGMRRKLCAPSATNTATGSSIWARNTLGRLLLRNGPTRSSSWNGSGMPVLASPNLSSGPKLSSAISRAIISPGQARVGALDAVAVGVGLDHRPDLGVRRVGPCDAQVVRQREVLLEEVELALADAAFVLHYQPIVDLPGGHTVAVEALLRWPQPDGSLRPPGSFIPDVERHSRRLMVALGRYVLRSALAQAAQWHRQGHPLAVSVNSRSHPACFTASCWSASVLSCSSGDAFGSDSASRWAVTSRWLTTVRAA